jgi:hypothetical protein
VGLERGPLSLVSTTEELLGRKSSGSCLENREYGRRDPSRWPRGSLYPQKLATTSPTSGGRSVGIARSRTQTMEFYYTLQCGMAITAQSGYYLGIFMEGMERTRVSPSQDRRCSDKDSKR